MYLRWKKLAKGLPKKYAKKYGITKRAWREYRKDTGAIKKKRPGSTSKPKRRKTKTTSKKKKRGGGGKKTFGTFGTVGLLSAGIMYGLAKYIARRYLPQAGAYTGAISAVAAGGTAKALNLSGKSLFGFGLVELVSEVLTDLVLPGGLVNAPWVGAGQNGTMRYNC